MGQALGCLQKDVGKADQSGEESSRLLDPEAQAAKDARKAERRAAKAAKKAAEREARGGGASEDDDGTEDDGSDTDDSDAEGAGGGGGGEVIVVRDGAMFDQRYKLKDVIGQGITSTVHICERVGDFDSHLPRRCACKLVDKRKLAADPALREHLNEQLANEISVMARLQHDNIVTLFDVYDSPDKMHIVMDLMTGGELFDHIIDKGCLSEKEAAGVIQQVASALDYCHKQGIVHRDLKPENLLLGKGGDLNKVKVADFGFAKDWGGASMVSFIGTPGYLAPELRQGTSYTETVDVWALGVILYVLLSGRLPFAADTAPIPRGKKMAAEHLKLEFPEAEFAHVSTSVKELMYHMLQLDPKARITSDKVLQHPWVTGQTASADVVALPKNLASLLARRKKAEANRGSYAVYCDSPKAKKGGFNHPSPRSSDQGDASTPGRNRGGKRSIYTEDDEDASEHVVCSATSATLATKRGVLRYAHYSQRGFDPDDMVRPNSDTFATVTNFNTDAEMAFFGVFDGHGDAARPCARFSRDQVQKRLARRLNKGAGFHTALRTSFLDANELMHKSPIDDTMSGANAVVVVLRDGVLEVANVGNARAVLAEEESDGSLVAKPLSTDQTPYRDDERARVRKCGARVLTTEQLEGGTGGAGQAAGSTKFVTGEEIDASGDPPRIWAEDGDYPGTTFTRSIGDSLSERIGLIAEPELESCPLSPQTKFVVLGSDGLFEFLTSQQVVDIVSQFDDPLEACRAVVSQAYSLWLQFEVRIDNITVIVIAIEDVPALAPEEPSSPRTPRTMMADAASLARPVRAGPSAAMRRRLSINRPAANAAQSAASEGADAGGAAAPPAVPYDPKDHAVAKDAEELVRLENACKAIILFQNLDEEQVKIQRHRLPQHFARREPASDPPSLSLPPPPPCFRHASLSPPGAAQDHLLGDGPQGGLPRRARDQPKRQG
jgi:serine/threonine protein kinase